MPCSPSKGSTRMARGMNPTMSGHHPPIKHRKPPVRLCPLRPADSPGPIYGLTPTTRFSTISHPRKPTRKHWEALALHWEALGKKYLQKPVDEFHPANAIPHRPSAILPTAPAPTRCPFSRNTLLTGFEFTKDLRLRSAFDTIPVAMESSPLERDDQEPKKPNEENGEDTGTVQDAAYLSTLVECEHQAIDQFDKTILALAGGAFAVSFAFLKDIVRPEQVTHKGWLISAWASWSLALLCTLLSFYFSHLAMRYA